MMLTLWSEHMLETPERIPTMALPITVITALINCNFLPGVCLKNNMLINIIQHKRADFKCEFDILDLYTQKIEKFDIGCYNVNTIHNS